MELDILIQMDPIAAIDIKGDSSFAMLLEAQRRGYRIAWYQPQQLYLRDGRLWTMAADLKLRDEVGCHFSAGEMQEREIAKADVVLMRQDPPFNMNYISATYLLERICDRVMVINPPAAVRDAPEKLLVMDFAELMPPTLISANAEQVRAFQQEHGDIIVKPLYGNGGVGVFRISKDGVNLNALLDIFADCYAGLPVVAQKFLPEVQQGDKRILLLDGHPVGAIDRFPPPGEVRANMHVGGRAELARINEKDEEICAAIGVELRRRGLLLAGIDVIGGHLIEINVTSPTGMREIANGGGGDVAMMFWDLVEEKLAAPSSG